MYISPRGPHFSIPLASFFTLFLALYPSLNVPGIHAHSWDLRCPGELRARPDAHPTCHMLYVPKWIGNVDTSPLPIRHHFVSVCNKAESNNYFLWIIFSYPANETRKNVIFLNHVNFDRTVREIIWSKFKWGNQPQINLLNNFFFLQSLGCNSINNQRHKCSFPQMFITLRLVSQPNSNAQSFAQVYDLRDNYMLTMEIRGVYSVTYICIY